MKKILFLLIGLALLSCDPEKDLPDVKGKFDPQAMIVLRPANGVQLRSTSIYNLTAIEIVEQAVNMEWQSHWFDNKYWDDDKHIARSFGEHQKDYQIPALKMMGYDIINIIDGEPIFYKDFLYGHGVYITTGTGRDTLAYVPDSVLINARPLIEAAFADSNYTEVYRLFNEAFTFLPIE